MSIVSFEYKYNIFVTSCLLLDQSSIAYIVLRLTDFNIGRPCSRMYNKQQVLHLAMAAEVDDVFLLYGIWQLEILANDTARLRARSVNIFTTYFNLSIFSEQESLSRFRFRKAQIATVADVYGWTACRAVRNRFRCDVITTTCVLLHRLTSLCRWRDVEFLFKMHDSSLSEAFWEVIETFLELYGHAFQSFRSDLI